MKKLFKNKLWLSLLIAMFLMSALVLAGCGEPAQEAPESGEQAAAPEDPQITLATTTSTQNSGLLDAILPIFTEKTGYEVDVVAVGTGAAINMGESGDADVILVHSRPAEDEFVESGYGVDRKDVMYNDFLFIGPSDDPAGIKGGNNAAEALTKIAEAQATFVSRGDDSGTHKKELELWQEAGIEPAGDWYNAVGKGMGDTFRMADEMQGYTLIDRGTFLASKDNYTLEAMVEGDPLLFNPYGVIAVNPEKHKNVNYAGATAFIEWLTGAETQQIIGEFGVEQFGQPLFIPDAK